MRHSPSLSPMLPERRRLTLYRDFPPSQQLITDAAPLTFSRFGIGTETDCKSTDALLHSSVRARYQPLSRAPFAHRRGLLRHNQGVTELACCRSDLCDVSTQHVLN